MKAIYKDAKSSVQKINLVAALVRGLDVSRARCILMFTNKSAASYLYKALMSSIANAQNNFSVDLDNLYIKSILIGKGMKLKRFSLRARGRAYKVAKHYSNITVILEASHGSKG